MRKAFQHLLAGLAVIAVVGSVACQQRQEVDDDDMGADTLMMQDTTMMPPPPPPPTGTDTMMGHDTMDLGAGDTSAM